MFERFTPQARAVVVEAQQAARGLRHNYIGTEHILLALASQESGIAVEVLTGAGVSPDGLRRAVVDVVGVGGVGGDECLLGVDDARALKMLGIDLDVVRARIEEVFGPGALDRPVTRERARLGRRRWGRRRTTCAQTVPGGHIAFTPRSKKVLELSLREALALGHNWIGAEHILLAVIREGQGLAAQLLVRGGVHLEDLRARVLDRLGRVA